MFRLTCLAMRLLAEADCFVLLADVIIHTCR